MINIFKRTFYKNGYLLIIAAWLYTISFIFSNYWTYSSSPGRVKSRIENYLKESEQTFDAFSTDTILINDLANRYGHLQKGEAYFKEKIGLFVYLQKIGEPLTTVYWNNNKMLPAQKDLEKRDGKYFEKYKNGYFEFIKKTYARNGRQIIVCAVVPVYWKYFIDNKYLKPGFETIDNIEKRYEVVTDKADVYIKNGDGKTLFGLIEKKDGHIPPGNFSIILRLVAIVFFLIFLNVFSLEIVRERGWVKGFSFLVGALFFLRVISYFLPFPFDFRSLSLFDASVYASNSLHPSLGDLLINVILLYWLTSFAKFAAVNKLKKLEKITGKTAWWLTALLAVILITLTFLSAGVVRSLIKDGKIPFDVTNFFSLNIFTLLSFIILCFIILTFFHISHIVLLFMYKAVGVPLRWRYLLITLIGMVYLTFRLSDPATTSNIIVLIWLVAYLAVMEYRKDDIFIPVLRSSFFIIWIIIFAASISALIIYQYDEVELLQRKEKAVTLASEADPSAEYLFNAGIADIDSAFFTNNLNRLTSETSNKTIKDSLISQYFTINSNRYDIRLYTFDNLFRPLYNDDSIPFSGLNRIIINRSKNTDYPDLRYFEKDVNEFSFIYNKEIFDNRSEIIGYFFLVADPKKYKSQTVYPELFKQGDDEDDYDVTYAIYNKGNLVKSNGDYNFVSHIPAADYPKGVFDEYKNGGNKELRYNAGNKKMVIIVSDYSASLEFITLFSYLFGSLLFIVVVFKLGDLLIRYKFRLISLKNSLNFNIKNQIQGAIIFISIFSFLVIGIATILFYNNRYKQTNGERLVKAIKILANEIETRIASHNLHDDSVSNYETGTDSKLQRTINEISEIHNVDANFYDLQGTMQASTQPDIYNRQVLSKIIDPIAFFNLHYKRNTLLIQNESVSHLKFLSIYVPVNDEYGRPYAYLNLPYLNNQKELNQEISNFLVTLINLNAFIFVIAGAISVLLTNRITNSFTLIGNKMKEVNLGKANEKINWNTRDEIGVLVSEYNKMVKKLEDSAVALAKSEREGAWREMARQVAHEIKNPLTPMKLSIQYLQKSVQENNPNSQELSKKVSATLVEQIDQLAKIASDFSQFANIGNVRNEVFDVKEIIASLINLYSSNEKVNVFYSSAEEPAIINADRTQINRLFTNLFQNAIEASDGNPVIDVYIDLNMNGNKLQIDFSDKGSGIPAEKQDKIFTPNFTTKSSGTGLGLAISKGIVENANGRIWFDTEEGKGTTFHILLPLVGIPG